ncbi:hypothetical protein C8R43DRAFT_1019142 [Mycena crocata]|nr:hypothetical protein C8R43DRAFT_1019142 [Mycena crocata]
MIARNYPDAFKAPPSLANTTAESRELRRKKILDEQKRRRAQRVASSRQLDQFADAEDSQDEDIVEALKEIDRLEMLVQAYDKQKQESEQGQNFNSEAGTSVTGQTQSRQS